MRSVRFGAAASAAAAAPARRRNRADSRSARTGHDSLAVGLDQRDIDAVLAKFRSSGRWHDHARHAARPCPRLNPAPDLLHHARPTHEATLSRHQRPKRVQVSDMSTYKSDFLNVLAERGFIHQVSEPEALDALARAGAITAYIGFDCTAPSLHVGSLLPIMMLLLDAADRPPADRADGRRHHARRRSFRQGREPRAS